MDRELFRTPSYASDATTLHKDAEIRRLVEELTIQKRNYGHLKNRFLKYLKNHSAPVLNEDQSLVYSRTCIDLNNNKGFGGGNGAGLRANDNVHNLSFAGTSTEPMVGSAMMKNVISGEEGQSHDHCLDDEDGEGKHEEDDNRKYRSNSIMMFNTMATRRRKSSAYPKAHRNSDSSLMGLKAIQDMEDEGACFSHLGNSKEEGDKNVDVDLEEFVDGYYEEDGIAINDGNGNQERGMQTGMSRIASTGEELAEMDRSSGTMNSRGDKETYQQNKRLLERNEYMRRLWAVKVGVKHTSSRISSANTSESKQEGDEEESLIRRSSRSNSTDYGSFKGLIKAKEYVPGEDRNLGCRYQTGKDFQCDGLSTFSDIEEQRSKPTGIWDSLLKYDYTKLYPDKDALKLAFRVSLATTLAGLLFIIPEVKSIFGVGTLPVSTCLIVVQNSLGGSLYECHRRIIGTLLAVGLTVALTNLYWTIPPEGFTSSFEKEVFSMFIFFGVLFVMTFCRFVFKKQDQMIKVAIFAFAVLFLTVLYSDDPDGSDRDRAGERFVAIFIGALIGILVSAFVFPVKACHQLTSGLKGTIDILLLVSDKVNDFYQDSKFNFDDREEAGQDIVTQSRMVIDNFGQLLSNCKNAKGEIFNVWRKPHQFPVDDFEVPFQSCRRLFYILMAQYHGVRYNTGTCHYMQIFQGDMLNLASMQIHNCLFFVSEVYNLNLFTGNKLNAKSGTIDGLDRFTFMSALHEQRDLLEECISLLTYQHHYNMEKGYDAQFGVEDLENYYLYFNNIKLLSRHLTGLIEGTETFRKALLGIPNEKRDEEAEPDCSVEND
eukprot:Nk52_evm3s604 gene=Nk52_evmTU3s604